MIIYPVSVSKSFCVQKNQAVAFLCRMIHNPDPDSFGLCLDCGSQVETYADVIYKI